MPLYIEKVQIWSGDTDPSHTDNRKKCYSACLKFKVEAESRNFNLGAWTMIVDDITKEEKGEGQKKNA